MPPCESSRIVITSHSYIQPGLLQLVDAPRRPNFACSSAPPPPKTTPCSKVVSRHRTTAPCSEGSGTAALRWDPAQSPFGSSKLLGSAASTLSARLPVHCMPLNLPCSTKWLSSMTFWPPSAFLPVSKPFLDGCKAWSFQGCAR
jgi:hypothetical protein